MRDIYTQQQNEITEHIIYEKLADLSVDEKNAVTLRSIARQELQHYEYWKSITGRDFAPRQGKIRKYMFLARVFGLSFALRLLEGGEAEASKFYDAVADKYPDAVKIKEQELQHEQKLIGILNDDRLIYAGAVVLGLNDALVEFTGTIAGLTFAFGNNLVVGATGLVMGVAASLSMAASGYLSSREEGHQSIEPVTSAIYTGTAYILTVGLLVLPYFLLQNPYAALGIMLLTTILIIAFYTYYISVAKAVSFRRRFSEMALISLGVAAISFAIGTLIKNVLGLDV